MAKKSVASFASSCLLVAILCGVSYYLVHDHCELNLNDIKTAQTLHIVGALVGVSLLVLSVLQILNKLNSVTLFTYLAVVGLLVLTGCMIYAAILIYQNPCTYGDRVNGYVNNILKGSEINIFTAKDGYLIAVFIMDIISALLFLGSTSTLYYA